MKVAIVTDIPFLYEDTMYLNELEKRLSNKGIIAKVFLVDSSTAFGKIDSATGITRIINTAKLLRDLSNFDVIDVQFTFPTGFALAFLSSLKLINKPIIIHTHGYDVFTVSSINYGIRRKRIGRFLSAYTWKKADRIIAVCEKSKTELIRSGVGDQKVDTLYNGIDETLFGKSKQDLPQDIQTIKDGSDLTFLSVASMVPVKNHVGLINAFSKLKELYGSKYKIKLFLIGNRPEYYSMNISKENEDVIYLGKKPHQDLPAYYNSADAFILPSLSEAHPWSLLEAMSCQLPVVASNVGGIPETLESQFLFDPYNTDDIVKKLKVMIEMSKRDREAIGLSNRQTILRSFTLERHINKLSKIFEVTVHH